MPENKTEAEFTPLEHDLDILSRIRSDPARVVAIQKALGDESLGFDDIEAVLPLSIWRLAVALRSPSVFDELVVRAPDETAARLREAKGFVDEQLAGLFGHPAFLERVLRSESREEEEDTEQADPLTQSFRRIAATGHIPTWLRLGPKFHPAVKLVLLDSSDTVLLDSVADWDTLLFVSKSLVEILAEELEGANDMVDHIDLGEEEKGKLAGKINDLESALQRVKAAAPVYGIETKASNPPTEQNPSKESPR